MDFLGTQYYRVQVADSLNSVAVQATLRQESCVYTLPFPDPKDPDASPEDNRPCRAGATVGVYWMEGA
jgi:hypothetical protein